MLDRYKRSGPEYSRFATVYERVFEQPWLADAHRESHIHAIANLYRFGIEVNLGGNDHPPISESALASAIDSVDGILFRELVNEVGFDQAAS